MNPEVARWRDAGRVDPGLTQHPSREDLFRELDWLYRRLVETDALIASETRFHHTRARAIADALVPKPPLERRYVFRSQTVRDLLEEQDGAVRLWLRRIGVHYAGSSRDFQAEIGAAFGIKGDLAEQLRAWTMGEGEARAA